MDVLGLLGDGFAGAVTPANLLWVVVGPSGGGDDVLRR